MIWSALCEVTPNSVVVRLDLIDTNGKIRELTANPHSYAYNLIDPRETYILVKIESM